MNLRLGLLLCLALLCSPTFVRAQDASAPGAKPATAMPSVLTVPPEAQPTSQFGAEAATNAYLTQIPGEATRRSDAYFEGGYWLILWDFLAGVVISILVLQLRWSAAMRNFAERITRFRPLQTFIYWIEYLILTSILGFPLVAYEGFFRERKYGLATQTFGPWMGDQFKGLAIGLILGGIIVVVLFALVRRLPRTWWIWGAIATMAFVTFVGLID